MATTSVKALLLDIGGVLLSKGWGRDSRARAAERFGYDHDEVEERHSVMVHAYEEGDASLDEYLDQVVFYRERDFTRDDYKSFIFSQSRAHRDTIEMFRRLKGRYDLRTVAVSNEGREIAIYRAETFPLRPLVDFFVVSSFVHRRKPDPRIYRMALDQLLLSPDDVVYIDDTPLLADVGKSLGLPTIQHKDCEATAEALDRMGLRA